MKIRRAECRWCTFSGFKPKPKGWTEQTNPLGYVRLHDEEVHGQNVQNWLKFWFFQQRFRG